MANIYPYFVEFKNEFNTNFDLITAVSFTGSFDTPTANIDMEQIYSEKSDGTHIVYGHKFTSPAQVTITFVKKNYTAFSDIETRQFLKWIGGRKKIDWLKLYDQDMEEVCEYLGSFTEILEQTADSRTLGYIATFTSVTPWAFSPIRDVQQTFVGQDTIILENDSDVEDNIVRPYIVIIPTSEIPELTISNETTNRQTIIKNIKAQETLTIDNENKLVFSDNTLRVIGKDFYGIVDYNDIQGQFKTNYPIWIELIPGDNKLIFNTNGYGGDVFYQIRYRYPIQIGSTF